MSETNQTAQAEKQYIVGANLLNAIANYLATRPYKEVAPLLNTLQQVPEAQVEGPAEEAQKAS